MADYVKRTIEVCGYKVDICDFGYKSFYYPQFNGDAEFEVTQKGFKRMSSYLRTLKWANNIMTQRRLELLNF